MLFVTYINDLGDNVINILSKFANDTKIYGIVDSEKGCLSLQHALDQLGKWDK